MKDKTTNKQITIAGARDFCGWQLCYLPKTKSFPNNFVYSGYYDGSLAYVRGSGGRYWTSTSHYEDANGISFIYGTEAILPDIYYKYYGWSVRCVLPPSV